MTENKVIYACREHIEIALDDYVNSEEKAPQMKVVSEKNCIKCSYCNVDAEYELFETWGCI